MVQNARQVGQITHADGSLQPSRTAYTFRLLDCGPSMPDRETPRHPTWTTLPRPPARNCCGMVRRRDGSIAPCRQTAMRPSTVARWFSDRKISAYEAKLLRPRADNPGYRPRCFHHVIEFLDVTQPGRARELWHHYPKIRQRRRNIRGLLERRRGPPCSGHGCHNPALNPKASRKASEWIQPAKRGNDKVSSWKLHEWILRLSIIKKPLDRTDDEFWCLVEINIADAQSKEYREFAESASRAHGEYTVG
jgi:hypothetical protein